MRLQRIAAWRMAGLAAAALLAGPSGACGFDPAPFAWTKAIAPPEAADPGPQLYAVTLDPDVHRETRDGWTDLRLADPDGNEVSHLVRPLRKPGSRTVATETIAEIVAFETDAEENRARITVRLPDDAPAPHRLILDTPLRDFEKSVRVEGRSEDDAWETLVEAAPIYDFSRHVRLRRTEIDLPGRPARLLRVEISDFTERQAAPGVEVIRTAAATLGITETERRLMREQVMRIDRVRLISLRTVPVPDEAVRARFDLPVIEATTDPETRVSRWVLDAGRRPLDRLDLAPRQNNFYRRVVVEAEAPEAPDVWRRLTEADIHRLRLGGTEQARLRVDLPRDIRAARIRLSIANGDDPPLDLASVEGRGPEVELVFLAEEPDHGWVLHFGSESAPAPRYDLGRVLARSPGQVPVRLGLGPQEANPDHRPGLPLAERPARLLFGFAVTAAVLLLVWMVARGATRIDALGQQAPPADGDPKARQRNPES